jgi:hypothetical protein
MNRSKIKPYSYLSIVLITSLFMNSCNKIGDQYVDIEPGCLSGIVQSFNQNVCRMGVYVDAFEFQNERVYLIGTDLCPKNEIAFPIYNEQCNPIGAVGGVADNRLVRGEDFYLYAIYISRIWQQE